MRECYNNWLHIFNGSALLATLAALSELIKGPWFLRLPPVIICLLVVLYFCIRVRKTSSVAPVERLFLRIYLPAIIAIIFIFLSYWPLFLQHNAAELILKWNARPLKYSGLSWPLRRTEGTQVKTSFYDDICLNKAKAHDIKPFLMKTSEFKLSAPINLTDSSCNRKIVISSRYETEWQIFDVEARPSSTNIDSVTGEKKVIVTEGEKLGHWFVHKISAGEHVSFICCWKYVGPIMPKVNYKDTVKITLSDSEHQ